MIWFLLSLIILPLFLLWSLVTKKDAKLVLWPEYFDKAISKNQGRRVPAKLATQSPTVEDIAKAAKKLKLNPKIENNKSYPGRWWRKTGRVLVQSRFKKTKVIRQVAIIIKKYKK